LFPTILLRAGELSTKNYPLFALIGEENKIAVLNPIQNDQALKLIGNESEFIPVIQKVANQNFISISGMEAIEKLKAGNFSIQTDEEIGLLALNYSRNESSVSYKNEKEIEAAFKDKGVSNCFYKKIENGQSLSDIEVGKPFEYWKFCLVLGLLFITAEIVLLKFMK
jgi:hypothetical protein